MPSRLKLIVSYDGASFAGWQSQAGGNTIQDHLEAAFQLICSQPVRVHGAGRTDAGVHAIAQCAHVDLPARRYAPERWILALNGILPPAIRIMRCGFVSDSFHARFSAKGKRYRYRIWNAAVLPPFESGRAWHVRNSFDVEAMAAAAQSFCGEHDFASFVANRGTPETDTTRIIRSVKVRRAGAMISIEFDGNGFLYKMVRMMVGMLVRVGLGTAPAAEIAARLQSPRKANPRGRHAAPADGLFLVRVRY
ncbi:MAG: tRNA pseudouridine(38-40) synthase TruA [Chthoniobacterales bacterium]|nr:MAG: tRNA pseudouridine(38-40) synthase TruA [Chthoniobacterales bacterium]